ncbi:CHAT domain-containing protein [Nonomuraea polychroma]|uniref:CHAT domain-containing protein n=1 Tax=Nonomuraea polychroma TaxID=46176 RepID=A0A438MAD4_9ACTN|nr:CHAT domain-containing protein [Nonomuraea polychroma]RVX42666.1 CHAT domain-containing protein [Nonomuraea polychroma]
MDELAWCLRHIAADHPHRGIVLAALSEAFGFRFVLTGTPGDAEAAVVYGEQAVAVLPAEDPQHGLALGKLAEHYIVRFETTGDRPSDLDAAIRCSTQATVETAATPALLASLAYAHRLRADLSGVPDDVDAQIRHAEHGLAMADAADSRRSLLYGLVAGGYERRHDQAGDIRDLDAAIACREEAAVNGWRDADDRARNLSNLSFDYLMWLRATDDPADVRRAVESAAKAVEFAGQDSPDHAELLYKLGMTYQVRFKLAGDIGDLHAYVELAEKARQRAPADYEGTALANLAVAYIERYEHAGDHRDMDTSIEIGEEALAHPGLTREQRGGCLANLSTMYRKRFQRLGAQSDLDYSLQLGHRAVRASPDGHPELISRLDGLADSYVERFRRFHEEGDLDTAIELCERALALPGITSTQRRHLQSALSGHLLTRFQASGRPADLDASVDSAEHALSEIDENHPQWPSCVENLAGALLHRHRLDARTLREPGRANLDKAIDLIERAMSTARPDSPSFLGRLANLAVAYQDEAVDPERRPSVVRRLINAVGTATDTTPTALARAQTNIGHLALQAGLHSEAAAMWRKAIELLPQCAPQGMAWEDQEHQLGGKRGLVGEAMATHLAIGDVAGAVELAELGRGILLSNQLDARADIAALSRSAPGLAEEFEQLVAEMEARSRIGERLYDISGASPLRRPPRHIADRWDRLLHRIRQLPDFSDFLAPPRLAELQNAASDGAVVLVNVGTLGGDAVVLQPDSVVRVPLPNLTQTDVEAHANALAGVEFLQDDSVTTARIARTEGASHDLLAWLWETVTEPVLTELGYASPPGTGRPMPRVWWVATGELSLLPLHAAGLPDGPSALDRVVSSYTPTIRALALARRRGSPDVRTQLTVTMRRTDGLPNLPASRAETAHLLAGHPGAVSLEDGDATAAAVLDALPRAGWVHFASHAISHPERASKSGLHLHDRTLRVPEISRARREHGELAYLSACSTGQGSLFQADEAVHLASAFQLAGYRHVVATLWPVNDQVAAMAARRFYRLLGDSPTADGAAVALHDVTLRLRARFPGNPELWAPFVHSGP